MSLPKKHWETNHTGFGRDDQPPTVAGCLEVNGIPSCLDPLMKAARESWNFTGYVTSDSDAVEDAWKRHGYVKTAETCFGSICWCGGVGGWLLGCSFLGGQKLGSRPKRINSSYKQSTKEGTEHGCFFPPQILMESTKLYLLEVCFAPFAHRITSEGGNDDVFLLQTEAEASCLAIKHGQCDPCHECKLIASRRHPSPIYVLLEKKIGGCEISPQDRRIRGLKLNISNFLLQNVRNA